MSKEKNLVKRAKKGDAEAFGRLYDKHMSPIYRFIFLRVRQKTDAEDLAQQVFLKAWKNIDNFEYQKGAQFSSWVYRIAKNTIIDYYRTNKEHADIDSVPENRFIKYDNEGEQDFIDKESKMSSILDAISKLNEKDQELIIMKFVEDLPNNEIARILKKKEGAIRVACHRAFKKLKKIIEEDYE